MLEKSVVATQCQACCCSTGRVAAALAALVISAFVGAAELVRLSAPPNVVPVERAHVGVGPQVTQCGTDSRVAYDSTDSQGAVQLPQDFSVDRCTILFGYPYDDAPRCDVSVGPQLAAPLRLLDVAFVKVYPQAIVVDAGLGAQWVRWRCAPR